MNEKDRAPLLGDFSLDELNELEYSDPVEEGAILGSHWLGRAQRSDGSFVYIWDPDNGTEITDRGYSLARHSASIYPLVWTYAHTADVRYLRAAKLAAEFTSGRITEKRERMTVDTGSLFDNALALIGYNHLYNATGGPDHLERLRGLADLCVASMDHEGRLDRKWGGEMEESWMASGEALLGLALSCGNTGDPVYREALIRGLDRLVPALTDRGCWNMTTSVYSWMASALSMGYGITGYERYREAAYAISDWIIESHFGRFFKKPGPGPNPDLIGEYPRLVGSFRSYPSMNTCTYCEGLGDVLGMAIRSGDEEKVRYYQDTLLNASGFILELQYSMEEGMDMTTPELTVGGFRHDLFDDVNEDMGWQSRWIRIDYNQHAVGALFRMIWHIEGGIIADYHNANPHHSFSP